MSDDLAEGGDGVADSTSTTPTSAPAAAPSAPAVAPAPQQQAAHPAAAPDLGAQRDDAARVEKPAIAPAAATALKPPGPDATHAERAAWRQTLGVPDDPSKYEIARPEGFEPTPFEAQFETDFRQLAHESDLSPAQVGRLVEFDQRRSRAVAEALQQAATTARETTTIELRRQFGGAEQAYAAIGRANAAWRDHLAPVLGDAAQTILAATLPDGSPVGSSVPFIQLLLNIADGAIGRQPIRESEVEQLRKKVGTSGYNDRDAARLAALLSPGGSGVLPPAPGAEVEAEIASLRTLIGSDAYDDAKAARLARLLESRGSRP